MITALSDNRVWVAQGERAGYGPLDEKHPIELPENVSVTGPLLLVRSLFRQAGLDAARYGTPQWNPLSHLIRPGDRVVLKPNWVTDTNQLAGGSMECLVTHTSVIEAVLHYVVRAEPGSILVADAPIQDCDFENLRARCGLNELSARFERWGHDVQIRDFRLTKMKGLFSDRIKTEPDPNDYCLFDIGTKSWLTPVTQEQTEFRVTNYDPDVLGQNHRHGVHRYLVAREIIDADVIISLPKLKTHRKAGVTGALKNMVGINGFKEYLPHHRKGGSRAGGDCYPGGSWIKRLAEDSLDRANRASGPLARYLNIRLSGLGMRLHSALHDGDRNLDGSWYGNDTVWRMCLDLQRILHYGTRDGSLSDGVQRQVITITDGIIAGDKDGPLAPSPVPLGIMTLGTNVAALEWVHCRLMRLDPRKIPLVTHAFESSDWPLADFSPDDVRVCVNGTALADSGSVGEFSRHFSPPTGWVGHCEEESG